MSCSIYRGRDICVIPFTLTQKSFTLKKFFVPMQTFSLKGIVRDHFQLSSEFLCSLLVLPPILIVWAAYVFVFVALSISRLIGFGFVLRVRSPSVGRLPMTKL